MAGSVYAPIKTFNQSFSCMGPLVLPVDLDFTTSQDFRVDLTDQLSNGFLDYVSSVYINLLDVTTFDLRLTSNDLKNQVVYCKRGTIVYAPLMLSNWPIFDAHVNAVINSVQQILVSNIPFFPFTQTL